MSFEDPEDGTATVPNVIDQDTQVAIQNIKAARLNPVVDGSSTDSKIENQSPVGGTIVPKGSDVELKTIAVEPVVVPNVTGNTFEVAKDKIENVGLHAIPNGDPQNSIVESQIPAGSTLVPKDSNVQLNMIPTVQVPSALGRHPDIARSIIELAGLHPIGGDAPPSAVCIVQFPKPGVFVPKNTDVHLGFEIEPTDN